MKLLFLAAGLLAAAQGQAAVVPGVVQAEDYDAGGEGVAYHDTTVGNTGGGYRMDDVDIESNGPTAFHVGFVAPGEWLRYTVEVTNDCRARLRHRVASAWPNGPYAWRVSLDGRTVDVQNGYPTGGWTVFASVTSPLPFEVTAGIHTLRVDFILGEFNLDEFELLVETNAPLPYQDAQQPVTNRVADLMARMTLEEKVGQLCLAGVEWLTQYEGTDIVQQQHQESDITTHRIGALLNGAGGGLTGQPAERWTDMTDRYQAYAVSTPLGIPMIYGVDAVHGHGNIPGATIFPHNIGLGASLNPWHAERAAQVTAVEVRATGMHWVYAPALTVARDERWGRFYEAFGETPEQATAMGLAALRGYQGSDLSAPTSVLASIKHFAGDGGTQWGSGRDGKIDQGNVVLDEAAFRALHLAPYSNAVAAGALNVMASYSGWNGQKMHNHTNLLTGVLKGEFGFEGFIVSDWGGVDQVFPNYAQSLVACVNAGLDMVMVPGNYLTFLGHVNYAVTHGNIPMARLDDAVRRILAVKFELGLFEHPFADRSLLPRVGSAEHRAAARAAVRDSVVVLKNEGDLLPLSKELARVHVAGRHADNLGYQCGGWTIYWQGGSGDITTGTTIYEGITQAVAPTSQVTFDIDGTNAAGADVAIVVVGETPYAEFIGDTASISLAAQDVTAITNAAASGAPVVVVLVTGRTLDIEPWLPYIDALVVAWLPGTEGAGVADVLFGEGYPRARLPHSWPHGIAQVPLNVGDAGYDPLFAWQAGETLDPELLLTLAPDARQAAWREGASGFIVQSATSLVAGVSWDTVAGAPVRTNGYHLLDLPGSSDATFYRLWRP